MDINDVLQVALRIEDKLDKFSDKTEKRLDDIERTQAVCREKCDQKIEITKAKLTFYGSVIGAIVGIILLVIQKVF
jgi:tetrahydromethanopterin S-methyltransferase subunit G